MTYNVAYGLAREPTGLRHDCVNINNTQADKLSHNPAVRKQFEGCPLTSQSIPFKIDRGNPSGSTYTLGDISYIKTRFYRDNLPENIDNASGMLPSICLVLERDTEPSPALLVLPGISDTHRDHIWDSNGYCNIIHTISSGYTYVEPTATDAESYYPINPYLEGSDFTSDLDDNYNRLFNFTHGLGFKTNIDADWSATKRGQIIMPADFNSYLYWDETQGKLITHKWDTNFTSAGVMDGLPINNPKSPNVDWSNNNILGIEIIAISDKLSNDIFKYTPLKLMSSGYKINCNIESVVIDIKDPSKTITDSGGIPRIPESIQATTRLGQFYNIDIYHKGIKDAGGNEISIEDVEFSNVVGDYIHQYNFSNSQLVLNYMFKNFFKSSN